MCTGPCRNPTAVQQRPAYAYAYTYTTIVPPNGWKFCHPGAEPGSGAGVASSTPSQAKHGASGFGLGGGAPTSQGKYITAQCTESDERRVWRVWRVWRVERRECCRVSQSETGQRCAHAQAPTVQAPRHHPGTTQTLRPTRDRPREHASTYRHMDRDRRRGQREKGGGRTAAPSLVGAPPPIGATTG